MSGKIYHEELLWRDIAQINNTLINVRKELDKFNSSNNEVSDLQSQLTKTEKYMKNELDKFYKAVNIFQTNLMTVKKYMENEFDKIYPAINDLQDQIVMNKKHINDLQKQIQNLQKDSNTNQLTCSEDLISKLIPQLKAELIPQIIPQLKAELIDDLIFQLKCKLSEPDKPTNYDSDCSDWSDLSKSLTIIRKDESNNNLSCPSIDESSKKKRKIT